VDSDTDATGSTVHVQRGSRVPLEYNLQQRLLAQGASGSCLLGHQLGKLQCRASIAVQAQAGGSTNAGAGAGAGVGVAK
jgi:hypothetical protein